MTALTVRQPWAWLLFHGKPIENRTWWTAYRGPLAIAASKGMTRAEYAEAVLFVRRFDAALAERIPHPDGLVRGAIVGVVQQIDCVSALSNVAAASPWFTGPYAHVYEAPQEFECPVPVKGQLGFWQWAYAVHE